MTEWMDETPVEPEIEAMPDIPVEPDPFQVYVNIDAEGRILAVNSDAFLPDTEGWVKIDEGFGDKYHHAQGNYLDGPVVDERGIPRYKIVPFVDWPEGTILHEFYHEGEEYGVFARTAEETDADYVPPAPAPDLVAEVAGLKEKNAQLEEALSLLLSGETEEAVGDG